MHALPLSDTAGLSRRRFLRNAGAAAIAAAVSLIAMRKKEEPDADDGADEADGE